MIENYSFYLNFFRQWTVNFWYGSRSGDFSREIRADEMPMAKNYTEMIGQPRDTYPHRDMKEEFKNTFRAVNLRLCL